MDRYKIQRVASLLADCGGNVKTGPLGTALKVGAYSTEDVPLISVREIGYGSLVNENNKEERL